MWEAIASNRRRSRILILVMGMLLMALGGMIGMSVDVEVGWFFGLAAAFLIWLVMYLTAINSGDSILLHMAGAKKIQKEDCPVLYNVVEEMCLASGLTTIPAIYIMEDSAPNAFAVGRTPEKAAVAVTIGLLRRLNRDELQGVIAHELGHIKNLDIRFMTLATVMVGSIAMLSDVFLRSMCFSGRSRYRSSNKGNGQAQAILFIITIILAILAPIIAHALYFSCSRKREYLADASAARYTRYPEGLASALEKISHRVGGKSEKAKDARTLAPLYIVNPLKATSRSSIFSTHPPIDKRVRILRSMTGGASFGDYEAAYRETQGNNKHCMGSQSLANAQPVKKRKATPIKNDLGILDKIFPQGEPVREALDHFAVLNNFIIIPCACGMELKVPSSIQRSTINCPRCGHHHEIPTAEERDDAPPDDQKTMTYKRKVKGWELFQCNCGHNIQISPNFAGPSIRCPSCKCTIKIVQYNKPPQSC